MFSFKKKKAAPVVNPVDPQNELIAKIAQSSNDFEFVQMDKSIHDVRFQTKPSSFLSDALKRFVKNRSSVIASVILGILIGMAIIVPIADSSPVGAGAVSTDYQSSLPPRWQMFLGTGFLDGTSQVEGVVGAVYNKTTKTFSAITADSSLDDVYPTGVYMDVENAVVPGTVVRTRITTSAASEYGYGGSLGLTCGSRTDNATLFTPTATYKTKNDYSLSVVFDKEAIQNKNVTASYRVFANVAYVTGTYTPVPLTDWSTDYSDFTLTGISAKILAAKPDPTSGKTEFSASIGFELQTIADSTSVYPSLYFKSAVFTLATGTDSTWTTFGFTDANEVKQRDTSTDDTVSAKAWKSGGYGVKSIRGVNLVNCSFRYDKYIAAFGDVAQSLAYDNVKSTYIADGWMKLDATAADPVSTFEILDDRCPIRSISSVIKEAVPITDENGKTVIVYKYTVNCNVSIYRLHGFSEIPSYFFGTDNHGWDYFKYLFSGLRTSLFLGVLCALINISFGLIWGSVSGYFGGWVDLLMERFTEILGGVPWIVVMTLCVLNLGQSFWVFLLALCLTGWMGVAGTTRSQFYRFKGREYVLASRTLGANDARLIFKHILPNSMGTIITGSVLIIPSVIFSEATISYLGLGLKGNDSFGVALSDAQGFLKTEPYLIICGSIIVSLLMISFNLFGNGLRDAFNPSLKGSED